MSPLDILVLVVTGPSVEGSASSSTGADGATSCGCAITVYDSKMSSKHCLSAADTDSGSITPTAEPGQGF